MLTNEEARRRRAQYGPNQLPEKPSFSAVGIFLHQFTSPLIFVLLAAAGITAVIGDGIDTLVIGGAVVVNTILGFIQEYKAGTSLAALKKILTPQAKVIRDGQQETIPARDLVPGDTVALAPGDRIPADGRVIEPVRLFVNEAMLTGESVPVEKSTNEAFMGTTVVSGRGKMEVTATGKETTIGRMAQTLEKTEKTETPLQRETARLARSLAVVVLALCTLLFFLGIVYGEDLVTMLATAVAIAVSAIPEGLVVSLTVILALGMQRIMKRKALVRRMVAAETLGSVSTICVDKTGTITQGVMRVVKTSLTHSEDAVKAAVLANNLEDPLEVAIWDWAKTLDSVDPQEIVDREPRVDEIPFDSTKKYMAVTTQAGQWLKGAPEVVIGMSTLTKQERRKWMETVEAWGREGLKVIALGRNETFLGILGIADPVREGVAEAVAQVRRAGVSVIMVTGDYRSTAEAVMKEIGLPTRDTLFCRVTPMEKLNIVEELQARGEVVAMTGDGVNDALAIKKADIGIVVAGASDVARETADVVLLDANVTTIAAAIEEGRAIFEAIRKVTLYLLSDAFVEIGLLTVTILLGLPLPLTAIQILWINLVDDGFPTLALTLDPRSHDLMRRLPRKKTAPIVDREMIMLIGIISVLTAIAAILAFFWAGGAANLMHARTVVFTLVSLDSLLYVFSCRRIDAGLAFRDVTRNRWLVAAVGAGLLLQLFAVYHPWGNHAFGTVPIGWDAWGVIAISSAIIVGMIEGVKTFTKVTK